MIEAERASAGFKNGINTIESDTDRRMFIAVTRLFTFTMVSAADAVAIQIRNRLDDKDTAKHLSRQSFGLYLCTELCSFESQI